MPVVDILLEEDRATMKGLLDKNSLLLKDARSPDEMLA
jgi:hypothetical protein